jgi:hypothetical protein
VELLQAVFNTVLAHWLVRKFEAWWTSRMSRRARERRG